MTGNNDAYDVTITHWRACLGPTTGGRNILAAMRVIAQNGFFLACAVGSKVFVFSLTVANSSFELSAPGVENVSIVALAIDKHFIFAAFSNKDIVCWNIDDVTQVTSTSMKKVPAAIGCAEYRRDSQSAEPFKYLLVSDKAGDVWAIDSPNLKKQIVVAGHTASVVTDLLVCDDLAITCDRDEKIRVSALPDLTRIESYCLGHNNVVTSVAMVSAAIAAERSYLISVSWDGTLILWDHMEGRIIRRISCRCSPVGDVNIDSVGDDEKEEELVPDALEQDIVDVVSAAGTEDDALDEIPEKVYSQPQDSRYPIKVAASPNGLLVAVIFNNSNILKVYSTATLLAEDMDDELTSGCSFVLQCNAYDMIFTGVDELVVIVHKPSCAQCLRLSQSPVVAITEVPDHGFIHSFRLFCGKEAASFSPQVVLTQEHEHGGGVAGLDKGIKKHCLSKPFNPLLMGVDSKTSKNHRSRKRRKGDTCVSEDL